MAEQAQVDANVARRVVMGELAPALPAATEIQRALINYLRTDNRAVNKPDEALKIMSGKNVPPRNVALAIVDSRIGPLDLPVDAGTGMKDRVTVPRPAYETTLYNNAVRDTKEAYNYLELGIAGPSIRAAALDVLFQDPGYRAMLGQAIGGDPTPQYRAWKINYEIYRTAGGPPPPINPAFNQLIENIVNNPGFHIKLNEIMKTHFDPAKEIKDPGSTDRIKLNGLTTEQTNLTADLFVGPPAGRLEAAFATSETALNQFRIMGGIAQPREARRQWLLTQIGGQQGLIDGYNATIGMHSGSASGLGAAAAAAANAAIVPLRGNLATAEGLKAQHEAELKGLEAEEKTAKAAYDSAQQERSQAQKRLAALPKEIAELNAKLAPFETQRRAEEVGFANSITGLFSDATVNYLNDMLQAVKTNYGALMDQRNQTEKDAFDVAYNNEMKNRYFGPSQQVFHPSLQRARAGGSLLFAQEREISGRNVEADMDEYRNNATRGLVIRWFGGPGGLIERQVRERNEFPVAMGALPAPLQREVEQRTDQLVREKGDEIVLEMLSTQMRYGIRPTLADVRLLQKNNPGIVSKMCTADEKSRKEIEDIAGKGGISDISRLPEGVVLRMLLAGLGSLAFGARGLFGLARPY